VRSAVKRIRALAGFGFDKLAENCDAFCFGKPGDCRAKSSVAPSNPGPTVSSDALPNTGDTVDKLFLIEWAELLIPTHSLAEIILRGTVMYLSLFLILRFLMLRQSSTIGIADILVIVVIADAAQNGFAKEYKSITEGIVLVLTIVFWDILLNWLSYRFKAFERLLAPAPLTLIENGRMNRRNLRKEFITEDELRSQMRQQGVSDFTEVKRACLEANGEISVVKIDSGDSPSNKQKKPI
jgi:uncharacterized membrane protein YcaP (DUF421 family)